MPRPMKFPKSFKLLDHTIKVSWRDDLYDEHDCYGLWTQKKLLIEIDTECPPSLMAHTLWHEIAHAVLDLTGHPDLSRDEDFVDRLGGALAQVVRTLK